ncbi:hypothetical protein EBR78_08905 [bacterium]|nr:hypothetical protein [bacterium]
MRINAQIGTFSFPTTLDRFLKSNPNFSSLRFQIENDLLLKGDCTIISSIATPYTTCCVLTLIDNDGTIFF